MHVNGLYIAVIPAVLLCLQFFILDGDVTAAWAVPIQDADDAVTIPGTIPEPYEMVVVTPTLDGTLYETTDGSLANGGGAYIFVGKTGPNAGEVVRRGLVKFDLPSSIPAGSTVITASLHMTVVGKAKGGARNITLHKVQTAWGEGTSDAGFTGRRWCIFNGQRCHMAAHVFQQCHVVQSGWGFRDHSPAAQLWSMVTARMNGRHQLIWWPMYNLGLTRPQQIMAGCCWAMKARC